jgi:4-carboxymuconolactone decarboxylase
MIAIIDPCEPPFPIDVAGDLAALMPPGVPPIGLFRVLAHDPRILSRFRAGRLLDAGTLSIRERELLILRVCHQCGCTYEWSIHDAVFAGAAGLTEADLQATRHPTAGIPLQDRERLMLAAADELVAAHQLTEATATKLRRDLRPAEIVELIALVGRYIWVSMIANTAALPQELGARTWAKSVH